MCSRGRSFRNGSSSCCNNNCSTISRLPLGQFEQTVCHYGILLMNDLHCVLVLLVDTVLISVLHVGVQDLVEGVGLNRIEQFLEPELLLSNGVRDAMA
jgi:hypothetical protein